MTSEDRDYFDELARIGRDPTPNTPTVVIREFPNFDVHTYWINCDLQQFEKTKTLVWL